MNVLHVVPAVAPRYGGPSRAVYGICRALRDRGAEVLVAATDADGGDRIPVELQKVVDWSGIPSIFFPRQWSESFKLSLPFARWVERSAGSFDLVHIHAVFSHTSLAAARACRRKGVPYLVRPLGSLEPWSLRWKRWRKRALWHLEVGRMLRHAAAIHYTTAEEKRSVEEKLGLGRGVVVPLGIEEELLRIGENGNGSGSRRPAPPPYVLVLSRLHPKKGIDLLLEAFLDVTERAELGSWRLVIAGEGDEAYKQKLKRTVSVRSAEGRVHFTGWLDGPEKVAALQHASLVALTSKQENFALAIVEAMACGAPVLVSDRMSLAEEIRAGGAGWVTALHRPSVARILIESLSGARERASRGSAGREMARQRYRWEVVAERLEDCYRSILADGQVSHRAESASARA